MADLDDAIDRLYQEPFDKFTDARNALAKASRDGSVKTLPKPTLPAWAVNQLHWHHRPSIERLVAAADAVRDAHRRTLTGHAADVAAAEQAHRAVVKEVLAEAKALLETAGHPQTAATLDAIRETLQVLPSDEANGRLAKALSPRGFEALAGFAVAPGRANLRVVASKSRDAARAADAADAADAAAAADDAEEAAAERARAQKEAEREERERRRAAEKALQAAKVALQNAEIALDDAERVLKQRRAERDAAVKVRDRAEKDLAG